MICSEEKLDESYGKEIKEAFGVEQVHLFHGPLEAVNALNMTTVGGASKVMPNAHARVVGDHGGPQAKTLGRGVAGSLRVCTFFRVLFFPLLHTLLCERKVSRRSLTQPCSTTPPNGCLEASTHQTTTRRVCEGTAKGDSFFFFFFFFFAYFTAGLFLKTCPCP